MRIKITNFECIISRKKNIQNIQNVNQLFCGIVDEKNEDTNEKCD